MSAPMSDHPTDQVAPHAADVTETIFALSSAPGRAGVSVVRLSGPRAGATLEALTARALPAPRRASLCSIYNEAGVRIDQPLVLWFPAPRSFTGEDCVELHIHGSVAILEATAGALLAQGVRQARPGEFTRRAVEQGKMDLTEAEGLADLIDARTEGQRLQALQNMEGGLRARYEGWQAGLLDALAQIEGEIDFADEADVPDALSHAAYPHLDRVGVDMNNSLRESSRGRAIRDGLQIAIVGVPNAGKSTLLNTIAGRDVAMTSPVEGTTRDIVEAHMVLAGLPVVFADTAGLRTTEDALESEGIRRAQARAEAAHVTILVQRPELKTTDLVGMEADFVFINKDIENNELGEKNSSKTPALSGNAKTGDGVDSLVAALEAHIQENYAGLENAALTRQRHLDCVRRAFDSVAAAKSSLADAPELASEDIRIALMALEELSGRSDMDEVFDRIFSSFCIGK